MYVLMKAATGELNLTLITVIALGAILALFTTVLWPQIKDKIVGTWDDTNNTDIDITYNNYDYEFTDYVQTELF